MVLMNELVNQNTQSIVMRQSSTFSKESGIDEHYTEDQPSLEKGDFLIKFNKKLQKKNLLDFLQNPHLSMLTKLERIQNDKDLLSQHPMVSHFRPDILAGSLRNEVKEFTP
jgi:hypothetical protein